MDYSDDAVPEDIQFISMGHIDKVILLLRNEDRVRQGSGLSYRLSDRKGVDCRWVYDDSLTVGGNRLSV